MTMPISQWLATPEIKKMRQERLHGQMAKVESHEFFRDPLRNLKYNPMVFYSPADGIVLYALPKVDPAKTMLEIKGKEFTLQDLLSDKEYVTPSLVVGIFMTCYDIHVNRIPTNGYFSEERETPFIYTHNTSMVGIENNLFEKHEYDAGNLKYLFANQRKISTIHCAGMGGKYYIVQIADKEIDVITNWDKHKFLRQGDRFGLVRWGSQVDVCIPLRDGISYKILVSPLDHVEAGIDPIIQIGN